MRVTDGHWTFSPTDLATFVRCEHAIQLRKRSRDGTLIALAAPGKSKRSDMLSRRGGEHEDKYVAALKAQGKAVVEISGDDRAASVSTMQAMHERAEVIVQGALWSNDWFGYADLLERVDTPSSLGGWSYEVADTKLALSVQPRKPIGSRSRSPRCWMVASLPVAMHSSDRFNPLTSWL